MSIEMPVPDDLQGKRILDVTCGPRGMWFDKKNPETLYCDIRREEHLIKGYLYSVDPDLIVDFTCMPFADNSFCLVVFDPPHIKNLTKSSWVRRKYGVLGPEWGADIKAGFDECMRVLKPNGVLIFKWSVSRIKLSVVLTVIGEKPIFGHTTGLKNGTIWMTFIK
jgi:SAM-dependent methyltransferase